MSKSTVKSPLLGAEKVTDFIENCGSFIMESCEEVVMLEQDPAVAVVEVLSSLD